MSESGKVVIGGDSLDAKMLCLSLKQEVQQLEKRIAALQQEETPNLVCLNHFAKLLQQRRMVLRWVEKRSSL